MAGGGKTVQGYGVALPAYDFHVLYTVRPARNVEVCATFALGAANRMLCDLWETAGFAALLCGRQPFLNRNEFTTAVDKYKRNLMYARAVAIRTVKRRISLIILFEKELSAFLTYEC